MIDGENDKEDQLRKENKNKENYSQGTVKKEIDIKGMKEFGSTINKK